MTHPTNGASTPPAAITLDMRLERRLITIAAVVAVVWVVVHLAEVLVAVGLLAAARRVLHL